uniref:CUB domain-containing protein n=1 Tax=Romanomermis culicivorax TaxID=13658 RepID=A0A915J2Q8_ROMCU
MNYENKMSCDWLIKVGSPAAHVGNGNRKHKRNGHSSIKVDKTYANKSIEIKFINFELEEEYHCEYDYVQIFDGDTDQDTRISKLCGNKIPVPIISTGNALKIQFRSDDTVGAKGFVLEYRLVDRVLGTTNYATNRPASTTRPPLEPVINERITHNKNF